MITRETVPFAPFFPSIKFERGIGLAEMELREIIEQPPCSSDVRRRKIINTAITRSINRVPCFIPEGDRFTGRNLSCVPCPECSLVVYLKFSSRSKIYQPTNPSRASSSKSRSTILLPRPSYLHSEIRVSWKFNHPISRITTRADPRWRDNDELYINALARCVLLLTFGSDNCFLKKKRKKKRSIRDPGILQEHILRNWWKFLN